MSEKKENFFKKAFREMGENAKAQHAVDKANLEAIRAESKANFEENRFTNSLARAKANAKESWENAKMTPSERTAKVRAEQAKQIEDAFNAISDPISLFETIYEGKDGSISLIEQLEDNCKYEENWIESSLLENGIKTLSSREKQILILRYYVGKTQTEISQEIGISQAQVSRLEKTALLTLKKLF